LQANNEVDNLRESLQRNQLRILEETMVQEKNHFYQIIVATPWFRNPQELTETEIEFGPFLLENKPHEFINMWTHELEVLQSIEEHLSSDNQISDNKRLKEIQSEITKIKGVLN
jgi:tRNA (adenine22-N1)-methyltransferase